MGGRASLCWPLASVLLSAGLGLTEARARQRGHVNSGERPQTHPTEQPAEKQYPHVLDSLPGEKIWGEWGDWRHDGRAWGEERAGEQVDV